MMRNDHGLLEKDISQNYILGAELLKHLKGININI